MSAYIFGAICPKKGKGAGLVLPYCDTAAMNEHLKEISLAVDPGAHAVLILDQAGWHTTPKLTVPANITLMFLPSKAPELNPVENVWQFMRDNWLSNRIFVTTTTSSPTAATRGTSSSINHGESSPLGCEIGRAGSDQCTLV